MTNIPTCCFIQEVYAALFMVINARRMRTRVTVLCLFVCYQSPGFFVRLYDKLYLPACSSLVFLGFQLTEFAKTVSFERWSAFHGYFVDSSPDEWPCIPRVSLYMIISSYNHIVYINPPC